MILYKDLYDNVEIVWRRYFYLDSYDNAEIMVIAV